MEVRIVTPVWGKNYIETFLNISLPAQLSHGNIPELSKNHNIEYVICTSSEWIPVIKKTRIYSVLENYCKIEFFIIKKIANKNSYEIFSEEYQKQLQIAYKKNQCAYLLNADILVSREFFRETHKKMELNYKVVNVACPRGKLEPLSKVLIKEFRTEMKTIDISASDLMEIWQENVHDLMKLHLLPKFADEDIHPSALMWEKNKNQYYMRSFHLYPILIKPEHKIKFGGTIDSGMVKTLKIANHEIYTETENKKFFCIELTKSKRNFKGAGPSGSKTTFANYFANCDKSNFLNLYKDIYLGKFTKKEREELRIISNEFILEILLEIISKNSTHSFKIIKSLRPIYMKLAIFVVTKKNFIPKSIYIKLKKLHKKIHIHIFEIRI